MAVIPGEFKSFTYFGDNFTAAQCGTHDKHVARRMLSGDSVEDQSNPMFCQRITITFSASDTTEVQVEVWSTALVRICSFDSPALYRITTVADPGNKEAKDSLKKRREVIETTWRAMLNDAHHRVAITLTWPPNCLWLSSKVFRSRRSGWLRCWSVVARRRTRF